jgi:CheY-like chemotaxis protein
MANKKILIVDDSWVIRQYLSRLLTGKGDYEVTEAVDGKDALDKINETIPDCIILDLLMPRMNGIETIEKMNELNIKVPVIFLSADIQDSTRNRCIELGAVDFINKPPQENVLMQVVKKVIDK